MPTSVLVGYATRYNSTQEVAEAITSVLRASGLAVEFQPLREVRVLDEYTAVVIGAPLYMFRWHKDALRFLSRHRDSLAGKPVAIFALGPTHDPHDEVEWQNSWSQLRKALAKFPWLEPVALEMFGGKYDPSKLRFPINMLTGDEPPSDIRDWPAIRDWAGSLAAKLDPALA